MAVGYHRATLILSTPCPACGGCLGQVECQFKTLLEAESFCNLQRDCPSPNSSQSLSKLRRRLWALYSSHRRLVVQH
eukprot:1382445-Amorphochlora_amoeboformis.AAC.2